MKISYKNLSLVFAAGCLGGLANSLAVWSFGALGVTKALGVQLAPALTPGWLYPRLVWGGIWGILFLLPLSRLSIIVQGLILSLGPTLAQLFLVFPLAAHKGVLGLQLGPLTPPLVIFFNAVWGITAGLWLKLTEESK